MKRHLILLFSLVAVVAAAQGIPHNMVSRHTPVNTNLIGAVIGEGLSLSNGVLSATGGGSGEGLTTNDVQAIALTRAEAEAGYTEWECIPDTVNGEAVVIWWNDTIHVWTPGFTSGPSGPGQGSASSTFLSWNASGWGGEVALTATRTRLRPTPGQEAAWDAKVDTSDLTPYARTDSLGTAAYKDASEFATATDEALVYQLLTNRLSGVTFDFATVAGLYLAISNIVAAQGGAITNFPAIP